MRFIRLLAAMLMVLSGFWHSALFLKAPGNADNLPLLIFGIFYLVTGFVLYTPKKTGLYLGIFVPLVGMTLALVKIGLKNFSLTMTILVLIDVFVILGCLVLLLSKTKTK